MTDTLGEVLPREMAQCPECGGVTVRFRGVGLDTQVWVCPKRASPGHLDVGEVRRRIADVGAAIRPSRRWA